MRITTPLRPITFTADDPIGYLDSLEIIQDFSVADIILDSRPMLAA